MTRPRRHLPAWLVATVLAMALLVPLTAPEALQTATAKDCSARSKCRVLKRSSWRRLRLHRHRATRGIASDMLFAPDSVWNAPVYKRSGLDPSSSRRVAALAGYIEWRRLLPRSLNGGYANINADSYSTPIYRVPRRQRRVKVRLTGGGSPTLRRILAAGVPIPAGATPAAGTDGHMTIHQRSTDTLWEFWRARLTDGGWEAAWAGAMRNVSRNRGYYDAGSWTRPLRFPEGWNWGSTATSLPVAGGTVTLAELRAGRIDHALAMAFPDTCSDVFSWPAQRSDGRDLSADCIPQGAHLRIDPALNLATLPLHPVARQLAEAAQRYGMIVRDGSRVSAAFFLESPAAGRPSPYTGPDGLYQGTPPWKVLAGFPWSRLQMLPLRLCNRAPCLPR